MSDPVADLFDSLSDSEKPWQRQFMKDAAGVVRWESPKAHAAFRKYCELEDQRSVVRVSKLLGKSRTLLERWSRRWNWTERSAAYDRIVEEGLRVAQIKSRKQMAERQSRGAVLGQNIALQALVELQQRLQARGKHRPLSAYEAVRLFEACSKIERICRGEPVDDEVAVINVILEIQKEPRHVSAAREPDPNPKIDFDS